MTSAAAANSAVAGTGPIGSGPRQGLRRLLLRQVLWSYPGTPNLPEGEPLVTAAQLRKVLDYAQRAVGDPARQVTIDQADGRNVQRIVNHLRLGEFSEGVYAVKPATMWWTGHFRSRAKADGYTGRFPVRVLRELTDQPAPRGLDRAVQCLIICGVRARPGPELVVPCQNSIYGR